MTREIRTDLVERLTPLVHDLVTRYARTLPHLAYADLRLDISESKFAEAENGASKSSGDDYTFSFGIRVLAGHRMIAAGYAARGLGAADLPALGQILRSGLTSAYRRAVASAELKAETKAKFGSLVASLADTRLSSVSVCRDVVPAVCDEDPRGVPLDALVGLTREVSRQLAGIDPLVRHNYIAATTELRRELFASSEGALIDQSFALSQGLGYVIAAGEDSTQEHYDVMGHQRGWEILERGVADPLLRFPPFAEFAVALARDAVELCGAPPLPSLDHETTVVTDPHYNALLAHEIIGHPVELDRGLKMETAYAGRSWLIRSLDDHHVGAPIASPLVTAYSDPALPGYGNYRYDHEGTPARRVVHIDRGVFTGFMNSRQTAAVFGGEPNGHWKATDASFVPLIRMSTTVFAAGDRDPADLVADVEHGYYLAGHRTPSIAESRENFRISARKVYEIRGGRLGRLFRDGGIMADSRDYLMNVDAVGSDFRLYPIHNCGKGQPMQSKRLGNGGPTMRSRARLAGGRE